MDERAPAMDAEAMVGQTHTGAIRGLLAAGLDALKTRLDLAAVEVEIYLLRIVQLLLLAIASVACAMLALVFGLVSIVVALWDTHRMAGLLGGTGLFLVLALLLGWFASRVFSKRPTILAGTIQQLENDRHSTKGTP